LWIFRNQVKDKLIPNQSDNHAVQEKEEEKQMVTKLDIALLLVLSQSSENFCGIE